MLLQLYLHFPFCKRKCLYCDFCSGAADAQTVAAYAKALKVEIFTMSEKYKNAQVSTVFLGGGTPTLVPPDVMQPVLEALRDSFDILPDAEFTSEGNPGTVTEEWLDMAVAHGLNRLSLGVQAMQDPLLQNIGRIHTFADAEHAVKLARKCGVKNLNLDAMFGLPGQTQQDYLDTLTAFAQLDAQHISAYSLILEEGTPLSAMAESGRVTLPDEDDVAEMYERGIDHLASLGYERYEVSNFARPGFVCRHNLGYWQGEWYLGMGVAAHSMLPPEPGSNAVRIRRANTTDVSDYIKGEFQPETELIGAADAMFETMMLGLRTTFGVSERLFMRQHGKTLQETYGEVLKTLVRDGLGEWHGADETRRFALTPRGIEVQNDVLMRFMA